MSDWTDELKEKVVEDYTSQNPTPENSMDLVKQIAEEYEKTPNGVRMILSKAGVYVKKEASASSATKSESKGTRVSKADAISTLTDLISAQGVDVDEEILGKLTGKAAVYFTSVINSITEDK